MNILVPGGCGYIGAMLCPHLLADKNVITAYDTQWLGSGYLPEENKNMHVIKADIRDIAAFRKACEGQDAVVYLAGLTNNDFCEQEPKLAAAVNRTAVPEVLAAAQAAGVKRFVMASSVAAYGDSEKDATEESPLVPTTPYGKAKKFCEQWALACNTKDFSVTVTRSASVCGSSPRMRFDLTVNKMVHDAVRNGVIVVNGGQQKRSHISIYDICMAYREILKSDPAHIGGEAFNFVAENQTVEETALLVAMATGAAIDMRPPTDSRSYTVSGEKARRALGFEPKKTIKETIEYMASLLQTKMWKDSKTNPIYQNVPSVTV